MIATVVIGGLSLVPVPATGATVSSPNHPTNYLLVRGVDAVDGILIGSDLSSAFPRQSADWGVTWSGNKGLPPNTAYANFGKVVRFKGNLYVVSKDASTGLFGVYRTPPAAGNTLYGWSSALVTLPPGASSLNTTMNADGSYLYLGEYGDPQGGPRILRSADGVNWEVVFGPDSSLRHIHAVAPDPYTPGVVWATTGDGGVKAVLRSTSFGAPGSWQVVVSSSSWQAVQISFSPEWVLRRGQRHRDSLGARPAATPADLGSHELPRHHPGAGWIDRRRLLPQRVLRKHRPSDRCVLRIDGGRDDIGEHEGTVRAAGDRRGAAVP